MTRILRLLALGGLLGLGGCFSAWKPVAGPIPAGTSEIGMGTGVFIDSRHVVTAGHVARECRAMSVSAADGRMTGAPAHPLEPPRFEVAVLEFTPPERSVVPPPARFRDIWPDAKDFPPDRPGMHVLDDPGPFHALGYPGANELRQKITLVPETTRVWSIAASQNAPRTADQIGALMLGAPLKHGYSGGPVIDSDGAVLGIDSAVADLKGTQTMHPELREELADPFYAHGLSVAVASRDVVEQIHHAGLDVPLDRAPPPPGASDGIARATRSLARVFCFR